MGHNWKLYGGKQEGVHMGQERVRGGADDYNTLYTCMKLIKIL